MRKVICALLMALFLVGCAHNPPVPPPVTAIVTPCPEPPVLVRPVLALHDLSKEDLANLTRPQLVEKLIKSWSISMAQVMSYVKYLEDIIEGYRVNKEL